MLSLTIKNENLIDLRSEKVYQRLYSEGCDIEIWYDHHCLGHAYNFDWPKFGNIWPLFLALKCNIKL